MDNELSEKIQRIKETMVEMIFNYSDEDILKIMKGEKLIFWFNENTKKVSCKIQELKF